MDFFEIFMNMKSLVNILEYQYLSQSFHYYTYKTIILTKILTIKSQFLSTTHFNPNFYPLNKQKILSKYNK